MLLFLLLLLQLLALTQCQRESRKSFSDCARNLHMEEANFTEIIECLARSTNLTAHWEDTLWRLDQLERLLDKLHAQRPIEKYNHTPYKNIDDVMNIKEKVSEQDCQRQRHVVQAVRRKLFWHSLLGGTESTLFAWPWSAEHAEPEEEIPDPPDDDHSPETLQDLRCALLDAVQKQKPRRV
ncbi:uncharacterized protein LOC117894153 [Drosophila subobscura]|uniref:uncharacterized protein LOC117894153 n=1 Tax=Drosophila subobscura TaxID=7241 RepID=UPI00155B2FBF|nr:uncharacterized protein LOC117894153 [Drosophila subobscura]